MEPRRKPRDHWSNRIIFCRLYPSDVKFMARFENTVELLRKFIEAERGTILKGGIEFIGGDRIALDLQ
jgi:hypothetical protein